MVGEISTHQVLLAQGDRLEIILRNADGWAYCRKHGGEPPGPLQNSSLRNGKAAQIGFGKRVFWKRGLFRKVHCLEILEISENRWTGKQRRIRPFSRDSREFRDFRDSRDSSSEKTPFVMTPFSGPEQKESSWAGCAPDILADIWADVRGQELSPNRSEHRKINSFFSGMARDGWRT